LGTLLKPLDYNLFLPFDATLLGSYKSTLLPSLTATDDLSDPGYDANAKDTPPQRRTIRHSSEGGRMSRNFSKRAGNLVVEPEPDWHQDGKIYLAVSYFLAVRRNYHRAVACHADCFLFYGAL